jgi:hypothetical protein
MTSGFGDSGQSSGASFPGFPVGFGVPGVSEFYSVTGVARSTVTTIGTYTVPVAMSFYLQCVEVGGSNIGQFEITVDGSLIARVRTWFNGPFVHNVRFDGTGNLGKVFPPGSVITVTVTHPRPDAGDFEARIVGVLK